MSRECLRQKFGSHLSVAGGMHLAFAEAERLGCDCLAIFVKNQRQWRAPALKDEQIRLFRDAQNRSGVFPVIAHASYLLNLASPSQAGRSQSIRALIDELERCESLGVPGLVIHPGAHMGDGMEAGISRIAQSLSEVHVATAGFHVQVLLESTAGQGSAIGYEIAQLGRIIENSKASERLGICIDTCHLFAAGYDLRNQASCSAMVDEIDRYVGLERVKCMHTNDSKTACGSRVDRHEHITKGKMGKRSFVNILNEPRLAQVPRILETPKGVDGRGMEFDVLNLRRLRNMVVGGSEQPSTTQRGNRKGNKDAS